jgi:hypothetical protein
MHNNKQIARINSIFLTRAALMSFRISGILQADFDPRADSPWMPALSAWGAHYLTGEAQETRMPFQPISLSRNALKHLGDVIEFGRCLT